MTSKLGLPSNYPSKAPEIDTPAGYAAAVSEHIRNTRILERRQSAQENGSNRLAPRPRALSVGEKALAQRAFVNRLSDSPPKRCRSVTQVNEMLPPLRRGSSASKLSSNDPQEFPCLPMLNGESSDEGALPCPRASSVAEKALAERSAVTPPRRCRSVTQVNEMRSPLRRDSSASNVSSNGLLQLPRLPKIEAESSGDGSKTDESTSGEKNKGNGKQPIGVMRGASCADIAGMRSQLQKVQVEANPYQQKKIFDIRMAMTSQRTGEVISSFKKLKQFGHPIAVEVVKYLIACDLLNDTETIVRDECLKSQNFLQNIQILHRLLKTYLSAKNRQKELFIFFNWLIGLKGYQAALSLPLQKEILFFMIEKRGDWEETWKLFCYIATHPAKVYEVKLLDEVTQFCLIAHEEAALSILDFCKEKKIDLSVDATIYLIEALRHEKNIGSDIFPYIPDLLKYLPRLPVDRCDDIYPLCDLLVQREADGEKRRDLGIALSQIVRGYLPPKRYQPLLNGLPSSTIAIPCAPP